MQSGKVFPNADGETATFRSAISGIIYTLKIYNLEEYGRILDESMGIEGRTGQISSRFAANRAKTVAVGVIKPKITEAEAMKKTAGEILELYIAIQEFNHLPL